MKSTSLCALILATALSGLVGCATPIIVSSAPAAASMVVPPPADLVGAAPPAEPAIIQIREFRRSAAVSIFAWAPEENAYGLHARVRRDGSLIRDHRFYVSTFYLGLSTFHVGQFTTHIGRALNRRGFVETVAPSGRLLESTGISRDVHNCSDWPDCSPYETRGARVPDSLLRANRDSLALRVYDRIGNELILTVRRDVIDPYLKAVDSVAAALRKK